jgi:microcystin-dependent protein
MDEIMGTIKLFAGNYAPVGYALCNGQMLSVQQNQTLYSIIGNTYGGNQEQFALPDLRGRVPVGTGQGNGLSNYSLGQVRGNEATTLIPSNIPQLIGTVQLNGLTGIASGPISGSAAGNIAVPCATNANTSIAENNVISSETTGAGFDVYATAPDGSKTMQPFGANLPVTGNANLPVTINNSTQNVVLNSSGGGIPINNVQPSLGLNYIICINGVYPQRP